MGKILCFIEDKGLKIIGLKILSATREQIEQLYRDHKESAHYENLIKASIDGPVVAIAMESPLQNNSAELLKNLQGKYYVTGSIRFYFSSQPTRGVLHCSSPGEVLRETAIFFSEYELITYNKAQDDWVIARTK